MIFVAFCGIEIGLLYKEYIFVRIWATVVNQQKNVASNTRKHAILFYSRRFGNFYDFLFIFDFYLFYSKNSQKNHDFSPYISKILPVAPYSLIHRSNITIFRDYMHFLEISPPPPLIIFHELIALPRFLINQSYEFSLSENNLLNFQLCLPPF